MSSLRGRLTLSTLLAAGSLLLVAGILLDRIAEAELEAALDAGLEAKAQTMVALTEQEGPRVLVEFAEVYLPNLTRRELVEMRLADGAFLARSTELGEFHLPLDDRRSFVPRFRDLELPGGRPGRQIQIDFLPLIEGADDSVLAVAAPPGAFPDPGRPLVSLAVAVDQSETLARIHHFRLLLGLVSAAALGGLALVLPALVGRGLEPLVRLGEKVEAMEVANLGAPLLLEAPPRELRPLIREIDGLRGRIAASFERERRFSSNVAHELRTPIAELRNLAEVALRFPPGERENPLFYRDVLDSALRMERVAQQLLALSRLEEAGAAKPAERIELGQVVNAAVARHGAAADCRVEVDPAATIHTNGTLLDLLFDNLLSNALDHRDPGSPIEIAARPAPAGWRLTWRNRAAALESGDVERLFDRFWRKDEARAGGRHSGLGLALVRTICLALGIGLSAAAEGGIFEIALDIPEAR